MNASSQISDPSSDSPESWVDLYGDALYRFALSRVKDAETAQDLVQETFVSALRSQKNFKGRSSRRTWLTAILKHKVIDHYRKKNRETASNLVDDMDPYTEDQAALFDQKGHWSVLPGKWSFNPAKVQEQKEFLDIFYQCLAGLPERLAAIFMMREVEGAATEEICQEMDISSTNSWTMLYRARMKLRHCLEKNWLKPQDQK